MEATEMDTEMLSFNEIRMLEAKLIAAQWIWEELQVAVTRQSKMAAPYRTGGKSSEHPTMFDTTASEAAWVLRNTLRQWATEVACDCRVPYVKCDTVFPGDVKELAGWMVSRVIRFIPHPEALDEICAAVDLGLRVIDRPPVRIYLGDCDCGARLYGDPDADEMSCWRCAFEHDPKTLRDRNIQRGGELLVTAKEAARYVGELYGIRLTANRIRVWHKRDGKLEPVELNGELLFRFGDIVAIARRSRLVARSG